MTDNSTLTHAINELFPVKAAMPTDIFGRERSRVVHLCPDALGLRVVDHLPWRSYMVTKSTWPLECSSRAGAVSVRGQQPLRPGSGDSRRRPPPPSVIGALGSGGFTPRLVRYATRFWELSKWMLPSVV